MFKPSFKEVAKYQNEYSVVPVYKQIYADVITPITLLRKISAISSRYFLLESIEGGEKWGRYSFIGFDPKARITYRDKTLTVSGEGERTLVTDRPYDCLREYLADYKTPRLEGIPPFTGGLVGYYGYAMIACAEPVLNRKRGSAKHFGFRRDRSSD